MRTTLQQKKEILEMVEDGKTSPEIASTLGLSVRLVRKWRQVGKKGGAAGARPRPPQKWGNGQF